ncbi:28S ribosomal protein S5, mitochondrial [Tulasnella sp. 330]|nr:28S ribosomal protein S5, mitochondrial [Tulasnella sp. 330]
MSSCLHSPARLPGTAVRIACRLRNQPARSMARVARGQPSGKEDGKLFTQRLSLTPGERFPSILSPNSVLDAFSTNQRVRDETDLDKLFRSAPDIKFLNSPPPFPHLAESDEREIRTKPEIPSQYKHMYVLIRKRVVHQSGKGKIASQFVGVVVGNGRGIVGFGDAKSENFNAAMNKAEANAIKNCDFVDLFEGRTIWTDMSIKFGSTKLELRPRPRGFGLMCNPYVHQVCKAAGIKDISAKVHGSRNPMAIIKATLMLLHPGGAPLAMGDGIGGRLRREYKKQGIKSQSMMERERGRAFMEGGSWI